MVDAPVSGGVDGAQTRDLLVMVGGDPRFSPRLARKDLGLAADLVQVRVPPAR